MRVLAVTPSYPRFEGDYHGRFIHDLCRQLFTNGVDMKVLTPRTRSSNPFPTGFEVERFPFLPKQRWELLSERTMKGAPAEHLIQLPSYLASAYLHQMTESASIVHAHLAIPMGFLASLIPGWKPLVVTCHGSDCTLPFTNPAFRPFVRHTLTKADRVVAVSDFIRRIAIQLGAPPEKVETIYTGVDTSKFLPSRDAASMREEFGIPEGHAVVGALGRLISDKRVEDIIRAAPRISKKAGAVFLIGGDGPRRGYLEELAADRGDIRFLGEVGDAALFHRLCDVFVMASIREGLSTALQEAMATGCVPVAVNGFGCPELVDEGENGYLFEPGDVRGLADGVLRAIDSPELGSKARETIRKSFNFEDGAMKHLELYNDLIISYRK
jgi:glycosyltransferase involved in cell wall biosynthesis